MNRKIIVTTLIKNVQRPERRAGREDSERFDLRIDEEGTKNKAMENTTRSNTAALLS